MTDASDRAAIERVANSRRIFTMDPRGHLAEIFLSDRDTLVRLAREALELRQSYHELLYAVGNKYPDETRHETALRYIRNAEDASRLGQQGCDAARGKG